MMNKEVLSNLLIHFAANDQVVLLGLGQCVRCESNTSYTLYGQLARHYNSWQHLQATDVLTDIYCCLAESNSNPDIAVGKFAS